LRTNLQSLSSPEVVIKYVRENRSKGESNFNVNQKVSFAFDAILPNISGLIRKAILSGTLIGFLTISVALGLSLAYILGYRSPVEGWVSTTGLLLLILATTLVMGSLILELLSRIYRELPREDKSKNSERIELASVNPSPYKT
jgi:hypothetical protein